MSLQMISYFVIIIGTCQFTIFYFIIHLHDVVTVKLLFYANVWLIVYLTRLILLNHTCENVSAKAQETRIVLHNLITFNRFAKMREQILQFVLQISLRPLQLSGMGMFHFGYKFIYKFFLWVITTIIFLLQVDTSPIIRTLLSEGNNMTYTINRKEM
ncbi:uncharacterized protein LOC105276031 isoform X1 [Ooceraea biroi]|nr:uncharacterized protein LOC105276031 isoform X1 [Ooceraea biroi]